MKHISFLMALLALLMLGGCRFDPDGLLGNDPAVKETEVLSSYDREELCKQKNVGFVVAKEVEKCVSPSDPALIARFDSYAPDTIRIELEKMSDGTFPKINRLQYKKTIPWASSIPSEKPRDLTCKIVESPSAVRNYDCRLEGLTKNSHGNDFIFDSMELGHETCGSTALYKANFLFDFCESQVDMSYTRVEVFFKREKLPEIDPYEAPKP